MTRPALIEQMQLKHGALARYAEKLSDEDWMFSGAEGQWTAGQQLAHIYKSVKPLADALRMPKFVVKSVMKKANRPSRTYDEVVEKYHKKLDEGLKSPPRFAPAEVSIAKRTKLIAQLRKKVDLLCRKLENYSEAELDQIVLPHPSLGYITMREMMYFTIYHAEQHHGIAKRNLS